MSHPTHSDRAALATLPASIIGTGLTVRKAAYGYLGFCNLLTPDGYNPKTKKGRALGYSSAIMHFAPANLSGYDVCQYRSAGCTAACLNTAGHGGINLDANGLNAVQRARIARTLTYFWNRFLFNAVMVREVEQHCRRARKNGLRSAAAPHAPHWQRYETDVAAVHRARPHPRPARGRVQHPPVPDPGPSAVVPHAVRRVRRVAGGTTTLNYRARAGRPRHARPESPMKTVAVFAYCRRCDSRRMFDRISLAGYACTVCKGPKPKASPIIRRVMR